MVLGRTGKSGNTSIISTGSMPITKVGNTSSVNTTFTATTVVDGSSWTLSAPVAGDFAKTSDGWVGRITAVNDGTDTVTVDRWVNINSGVDSSEGSGKPAAGSTVTIHGIWKCKKLKAKADNSNGAGIHFQRNNPATTSGYELLANESLVFEPEAGCEYVDATLINAISASGTLSLWWCTECQ